MQKVRSMRTSIDQAQSHTYLRYYLWLACRPNTGGSVEVCRQTMISQAFHSISALDSGYNLVMSGSTEPTNGQVPVRYRL